MADDSAVFPPAPDKALFTATVLKVGIDHTQTVNDVLAVEEPLEIKIGFGPLAARQYHNLAITMRSPGYDFDLVAGFLFSEGIIAQSDAITDLYYAGQRLATEARENVVVAELHPKVHVDLAQLSRHFYTTSSCGVCGKTALELVNTVSCYYPEAGVPLLQASLLRTLPDRLRKAQAVFAHTGGLHASGLFDTAAELRYLREDVGRHNALDKVLGAALRDQLMPLRQSIIMLSGRISFELVQKAAMAGVPILAAVGAPSSLAVRLAIEHNMTLIGFLRDQRFNIYAGQERIVFNQ